MKIFIYKNLGLLIKILFLIYIILKFIFYKFNINRLSLLKINKKFIYDCKKSKIYKRIKVINESPYFSICISALNMEN